MNRMFRSGALALVFVATVAGGAWAEDAPAAVDAPKPAIANTDANNATAPVPGANSFTEDQVISRLADKGVTNVTGLAKDADGIWRGKGMEGSKPVSVALDYQGNIFVN